MTDDLRSVVADVEREMRDQPVPEDRWWARRCKRWADRLRDALKGQTILPKQRVICPHCGRGGLVAGDWHVCEMHPISGRMR